MAVQPGYGPAVGGNASKLNLSAETVVSATPATLWTVNVTTAGATGHIYDANTTMTTVATGVTTATLICAVTAAVGTYEQGPWPCQNGIVYVPGSSQVAGIAYGPSPENWNPLG